MATTELYQRTKLRAEQAEAQITHEQIGLLPLKKENARVTKENNSLHKEIILVKENLSQNDNNWQRQYKQLESEYNDIKQAFLAKGHKIKELERRNLKLEERLDSIMSKIYKPDMRQITAPMYPQGEENEFGSKQHMEIAYLLEQETNREIKTKEEEDLVNQICAADERVQIMTKELSAYKSFKEDAEIRIRELESMISERDKEISRLNSLYMGADNIDKMNIEFIEKENRETISKLNAQLDYINKENNRLHHTIADLRCKNKGNTGMYLENKKVVSRIEALKIENDDLRRVYENAQKIIETMKEREIDLLESLQQRHVQKETHDEALRTIQCQQLDIEKLKKLLEASENQKKIEAYLRIASEENNELDLEPVKDQITS